MPTYAYRCPDCSQEFERLQKITEPSGAECPRCGADAERVITGGAGLLFKGSGFYITDYRSPGYQEAAKKDSEKGKTEKAPKEGASEKKGSGADAPASKTEAGEGKK